MSSNVSVCTFNILAPCYKRLTSERDRESAYETIWRPRHVSIINLLQSLQISLICLQEFWLAEPSFVQLYENELSSKYSYHYVQRTHGLDDGLAIFVDRNQFEVLDQFDLLLNDVGNRVGLLLRLQYRGQCLLLVNVHLTFPHNAFDRRLRLKQMKEFLRLIDEYQRKHHLLDRCSIILCGDFNAPFANDPVYQLLEEQFQSSYFVVNGKEPQVTHFTHRSEELGVDFIFYQSDSFRPISSELIPQGCDEKHWEDYTKWLLSDHRALLTSFQFKDEQNLKTDF